MIRKIYKSKSVDFIVPAHKVSEKIECSYYFIEILIELQNVKKQNFQVTISSIAILAYVFLCVKRNVLNL